MAKKKKKTPRAAKKLTVTTVRTKKRLVVTNPRLTAKKRKKLPASAFADPKHRKYPIEDKAHADAAAARLAAARKTMSKSEHARIHARIVKAQRRFGERPKKRKKKIRGTTVTVRPNKKRGPDELTRTSRSIAARGRKGLGLSAHMNGEYWRTPRSVRAANLRKLARGGGRQRKAAIAIARAELAHEGPPRRRNPAMSDAQALAEYEKTHWGERGSGKVVRAGAPDPRHGTATKLGTLVEVVYRTRKGGDRGPTDYVHAFEGRKPELVYNDGGLLIAGGDYRIREGGIDG